MAQVLAHLQAEGRLKPAGQGEAGEATYRLRRKPAKKFQLRDEGAESERRKILAEKQARGEGPRTRKLPGPEAAPRDESQAASERRAIEHTIRSLFARQKRSQALATLRELQLELRASSDPADKIKLAAINDALAERGVDSGPATGKARFVGQPTEIEAAGFDKPIPARYAVFSLDDLTPSHDFRTGLPRKNESYPAGLQPREYAKDSEEVRKVIRFAAEQKAGFYLSTHPGADSGPPTADPDGVVINGNGRVMSLQVAAGPRGKQGNFDWYKGKLVEQAALFGLDPAAVSSLKRPVLVRVVDMAADSPEAKKFARAGNVSTTQSQSPVRTAASLNGLIDGELLDSIRLEDETTFSEAVSDPVAGRNFRHRLYRALPEAERARYFPEDGRLTEGGTELVRHMLLTKLLPVELVERLGEERRQLKRTIEGAIPQLLKAQRDLQEAKVPQYLGEALEFVVKHPEANTLRALDNTLAQGDLFKGKYASLSPVGKLFTAFLIEFGGKPLVFRKNVIGFIKDINMPLFGGEPSADEKAGEALDRLRQDQTAKQAEAKAGGPLFAGLDPKRPQPSEAQASIDALMSAFAAVEQGERTRNWVNLADLEAQLGWNRARFLAVLKAARQRGWLTLSAAEGKGGISDRDRKAGIYEDGALLLFASRKEGSAAEAAQRRADEATALAKAETERTSPMATLGGFGLGTGERQRADTVPLAIQAPSAEVEQRLQQARGIQPDSLASKIKAWATTAKNVLTRARQHLPNNAEFATANEVLRLLDAVPQQAGDEVSRTVAAIVDPLGPKQLQLFERKLIVDNLLASVDRGEPLRFGFESKAEVETYRQQLDALIEQLPAVQQALKTRAEVVREKVQQLVELDILDAEAARNPAYFHQQVLTKLQAQRLAGGGSAPQRIQRGFQKGRVSGIEALGEEFDYNTSYLEAEISWLTDAAVEAEKEKLFRRLATKYDIKPQLVEEAKQLGKDADWRDVLKDHPDHAVWSPEPGNTFYRAFTIPERVAEQLAQNVLFDMRLDPKDVGTALALTHPQRQFVLPKPLVAQLNETKKDQTSHAAAQVFEAGQSYWKVWRLFNPKSLRGYMTRNFFGDLDPVLTSVPGVLKYKLRAVQELWQYFYGRNLALSPALRQARNLAVIDGSLEVSEIPDLHELPVFKRLFRKDLSRTHLLLQAPAAWFKFAKRFNAFREASLRYAAFLYFRDQLRAGTLQHYGGARREVVDALAKDLGTDVAAAHLSRNLLGDYGNLTVLGQWLRKYVFPFWSFQEVQFKRWPRLAINAVQAGRLASKENALTAGALTALAALKLAVPYSLYWLWNNLRWPDEEQQLSAAERASPHIITGRNPDGSIRLLQRVSSQGEFLEWFGLDQLMQLLPLFRNEQITWGDVAQGVAKQPANKAFSALRPDVKGLFEVGGGLSFYPDAFNPQRQRRDDAFANIFGLADEARWARGQLGSTGERVRPGYGDRWAGITTSHPAKNALGEMFDLKDAFLKKQGKKPQERFGRSPIATMRDAAATNDHEAFREARQAYLADGHSYESFKRAIANLDPVAQLAGDPDLEGDSKKLKAADNLERKFVRQFLTDEQRTKLPIVRDYARRLEVTLWTWWQQASERDDSPEQRAAQQQAADKEILTAARRLASKKPVRVSEQAEWSHGIDSALDWLRRHDIDADRAEAAFREYLRKEVQTPAARQDALNRFRKTVRELEPRKEPTP
ncbi:MAG: hypothetical protein JNM56_29085 [Planctomycetia bacterium]|nr:hypothetical protein [Planctomycetia bacterium]